MRSIKNLKFFILSLAFAIIFIIICFFSSQLINKFYHLENLSIGSAEVLQHADSIKDEFQANELIQTASVIDFVFYYNQDVFSFDLDKIKELESVSSSSSIGNKKIIAEHNEYLNEIRKQKIVEEMNRRGNDGRFICEAAGIDVAVFNSNSQSVCDAVDSSCRFRTHGQDILGDHNYQGFYKIKNMSVGTVSRIDRGTSSENYRCVAKMQGTNTGYDLVDTSGNSVCGRYSNSLVLYTCNDWSGRSITIVILERI